MKKIATLAGGAALAAVTAALTLTVAPDAAAINTPTNPPPVCSKVVAPAGSHLSIRECISLQKVSGGTKVTATLRVSATGNVLRVKVNMQQGLSVKQANGAIGYRLLSTRSTYAWPAGSAVGPAYLSGSVVLRKGSVIGGQGAVSRYVVQTKLVKAAF